MAKTYINTVKYEIKAEFEVDGIVDKHDIIGAIFGQSEGLLGEDMDLRELQKGGKLGRIEITEKSHSGKTSGTVYVPSSMDRVQTALLAAAIESVDKVGPCDAKFDIKSISDARADRRKKIEDRAKELLKSLNAGVPETQEMTDSVRTEMKKAEITEYGRDKLPAGPDLLKGNEVIVVEGRADVLTLLKNSITNVVGMGGSNVPKDLIFLSKKKSITLFIDGDRGGELNFRKMSALAKVDYIARAPDGKEVEELTRKEIEAALRKKMPAKDFLIRRPRARISSREPTKKFEIKKTEGRTTKTIPRKKTLVSPTRRPPVIKTKPKANTKEIEKFSPVMKELENSLKARLLDKNDKKLKEISVRNMLEEMGKTKNAETIVFDGIVTKRLLEEAEKNGIKNLVGVKKGKIEESDKVRVIILG